MYVADKFGQGKKVATPRMCCRVSGSRWWGAAGGETAEAGPGAGFVLVRERVKLEGCLRRRESCNITSPELHWINEPSLEGKVLKKTTHETKFPLLSCLQASLSFPEKGSVKALSLWRQTSQFRTEWRNKATCLAPLAPCWISTCRLDEPCSGQAEIALGTKRSHLLRISL